MRKISAKQFQADSKSIMDECRAQGYNCDGLYEEGGKIKLWGTLPLPPYEVQKNFDRYFQFHDKGVVR